MGVFFNPFDMFNTTILQTKLKDLIGWRDHYDPIEIPAFPSSLTTTNSGQYFQDFNTSMRLDVILACKPPNRDFEEYLEERRSTAISQMANDIVRIRGLERYASKTLANDVILDKYGWEKDKISNNGRFVGFQIKVKLSTGLEMVIKSIGMQLTSEQNVPLYIYHTSKLDPIEIIDFQTNGQTGWTWGESNIHLVAEDEDIVGGAWIIGYYQDDLVGQAINYREYDWKLGPCSSCDGGQRQESFRNLRKYMDINPIFVPEDSLPTPTGPNPEDRKMFDLDYAFNTWDNNFGMNFRISAECDITQFIVDHKFALTDALGLKVSELILSDIMSSDEINRVQENRKAMIILELKGDKEGTEKSIPKKYEDAIKQVNFDHNMKSAYCLPCQNTKGVKIGVA